MTRVHQMLKIRNMTIAELARKTGISGAHCWNIVHDKRQPSLQVAQKIADILGKPVGELFFVQSVA